MTRVVRDLAPAHDWRIPEHFDESWNPLPDYNIDSPADPFRPYGATIGHWLEWARLSLHLRAALGPRTDWLLDNAVSLFDAAVREGWTGPSRSSRETDTSVVEPVETPGFVYTVDWSGQPVVRERMHWVPAEATATAAALYAATGDASYAGWYETWWDHSRTYFIDSDARLLAPRARPEQPPQQHRLVRQARRLPRLPGHPHPAAPAHPDLGHRPPQRQAALIDTFGDRLVEIASSPLIERPRWLSASNPYGQSSCKVSYLIVADDSLSERLVWTHPNNAAPDSRAVARMARAGDSRGSAARSLDVTLDRKLEAETQSLRPAAITGSAGESSSLHCGFSRQGPVIGHQVESLG